MAEGAVVEPVVAAVAAPAAPAVEHLEPKEALKRVLRGALVVDGMRRGLHESVKALAKATKTEGTVAAGGARLCVLASDCDEPAYVKLVKALCAEKGVPLLHDIANGNDLGEWAGLYKLDKEGNVRKVVSTSVVVITDFGAQSHALDVLTAHLKSIGAM